MYDPCPNYYSKQFGVLRALADADPPSPYPRARLFTHTRIYYFLFEGSDADELTRGRRPNWGGKWKNSYRDEHHGNKHKPNKHKPNKHRPNKPKPEVPAYCTPEKSCEAHSDCHKLLPCQETYCKNYKCVCEGELDAAAL